MRESWRFTAQTGHCNEGIAMDPEQFPDPDEEQDPSDWDQDEADEERENRRP